MANQWTPEQLAAIETRDRTVLLSAAAGSGKTTVLTERLIRSLTQEEHPLDLSRTLVVTFTRAAAASLKARIGRALADAIREHPENERLSRQLRLLPTANISTIDSYYISLLRRFSAQSGAGEGFRVAGEEEADQARAALMEGVIRDGYAGEIPDVSAERFCRLVSHLCGVREEKDFPALLLQLAGKLESLPAGVDALDGYAEAYLADAARPLLETAWGEQLSAYVRETAAHEAHAAADLLARCLPNGENEKLLDQLAQCTRVITDLAALETKRYDALKTAAAVPDYPKRLTVPRGYVPSAEEEQLLLRCRAFRDTVKEKFAPFFFYTEEQWQAAFRTLGEQCATLCGVLREFERRYDAESRRKRAFSFAQISRMTYALLLRDGRRTEAAETLRGELDAVYVDEYQDVNPLQHAIFEAVSREGARFLVGDIKQSIYRFRDADPAIFARLRTSFPSPEQQPDAKEISLFMSCNFRSDRPVIDYVNSVFSTLFGVAGQSIAYREQDALVCGRARNGEEPALSFPPVIAFFDSNAALARSQKDSAAPAARETEADLPRAKDLPDGSDLSETLPPEEEAEEEKAVAREARWIAAQVSDLLAHGTRSDGKTPLRAGDIAILLRNAKSAYQPYRDALAACGVGCEEPENASFFSNPEVLLALALLSAVDNPRRDVHLAAVLCSPLYRFTPDDLTAVRRETADGIPLYDALCAYCAAHPAFEKGRFFLTQLSSFRAAAEELPVDKLLSRLCSETPLTAIAGADAAGGENNLKLLCHYARTYAGSAFEGLYSFIRFVNRQIETGSTFKPPAAAPAGDAVCISTVHASKGLEYPVVFLAGCGTAFSDKDTKARLLCDRDGGVAFDLTDDSGLVRIATPVKRLLAQRMRTRDVEEEMRLLYVALTRAQERLYISGVAPGKTSLDNLRKICEDAAAYADPRTLLGLNSYLTQIWTAYLRDPGGATLLVDPPAEPVALPRQAAEEAVKGAAETADAAEFMRRFSFVYPYAYLHGVPKKLSVSRLRPALLDEGEEGTLSLDTEAETPAEGNPAEARPEKWRRMPAAVAGVRPPDPTDRGIATHLFLQFCDFERLYRDGVEAEIRRLLEEKYMDERTISLIRREELELFRRSALLSEIRAARGVRREFRFNLNLPAASFTADPALKEKLGKQTLLVQGVIDALIERPDGSLVLVDYKTDRFTREELAGPSLAAAKLRRRHAEQLRYYAEAVKRIFGRAPREILLYALQLGDTVSVQEP